MYLALRKCKNDCKVLTIILVPGFCPLNPEIARFSVGFRLILTIFCVTLGQLTRRARSYRSQRQYLRPIYSLLVYKTDYGTSNSHAFQKCGIPSGGNLELAL